MNNAEADVAGLLGHSAAARTRRAWMAVPYALARVGQARSRGGPPPGTAGRIDAIDFWRGFALVTIFVDHTPANALARFTHGNFGFSDAAEIFVFLSGISVGMAYGKPFMEGRIKTGLKTVGRRLCKLYGAQVLLSLLALAIVVLATAFIDSDVLEDEDRLLLRQPARGLLAILSLSHQIDYLNVLPLYIALLLLTPVLVMLARLDDRLMLAASAAVYLLGQAFSLNLPTWPAAGGWTFDPFGWQFLFSIGLAIGLRIRQRCLPLDPLLFLASIAVIVSSAFIVTDGASLLPGLFDNIAGKFNVDKTTLGAGRLVHFLALAYVVYYCGVSRSLARTRVFRPMCLIGRFSLPVFGTGAILSTVSLTIMDEDWPGEPYKLMFLATGIAVQFAVASFLAARSQSRHRVKIA